MMGSYLIYVHSWVLVLTRVPQLCFAFDHHHLQDKDAQSLRFTEIPKFYIVPLGTMGFHYILCAIE